MNHQQPVHDYYYGHEADQYIFYRLPKALFTNSRYKNLSDGAKILYGLMLDRMGLSIKNAWLDEQGRVYIYFTLEDVMDYMNCHRDKGMKMLAELDAVKGVGLIERMRQGLGKPTIIYVKKFVQQSVPQRSEKKTSSKGPTSRGRKNRPLEVENTDANNTNANHTDVNDIHNTVSPSPPDSAMADTTGRCRERVRYRIGYYDFIEDPRQSVQQLDGIVELMVEILCSNRPTIRIASDEYPTDFVKERFAMLTDKHIDFVIERLRDNTSQVRNIKSYLLTALFNAPTTVDHYYATLYSYYDKGGGQQNE